MDKENYLKDMTLINQRVGMLLVVVYFYNSHSLDELVREKELLVIENEDVKLRNEELDRKGSAHAGAVEKLGMTLVLALVHFIILSHFCRERISSETERERKRDSFASAREYSVRAKERRNEIEIH